MLESSVCHKAGLRWAGACEAILLQPISARNGRVEYQTLRASLSEDQFVAFKGGNWNEKVEGGRTFADTA